MEDSAVMDWFCGRKKVNKDKEAQRLHHIGGESDQARKSKG
jgi:hypothetical protein